VRTNFSPSTVVRGVVIVVAVVVGRPWCTPRTVEQKLSEAVGTQFGVVDGHAPVVVQSPAEPPQVFVVVQSPAEPPQVFVLLHVAGGVELVMQPVWAGLVRPMPWLASHS